MDGTSSIAALAIVLLLSAIIIFLIRRSKEASSPSLAEVTHRIKSDPGSLQRCELLDNEPMVLRFTFFNGDAIDLFIQGVFAFEYFREVRRRARNCEFIITRNGRRIDVESQIQSIWR